MIRRALILSLGLLAAAAAAPGLRAQQPPADGPRYGADGTLARPDDYREWVFLTSGLGMTYGPAKPAAGQPPLFDNVFVTRAAYRQFKQTGTWPEQTMFVLEVRRAEEQVSINNAGRTQGGVVAIEVALKDSARFPDTTWAYFNFGGGAELRAAAAALPRTQSCYACHGANTAVDNTFVQFYPELMEVARRLGTVKPTYDPAHKVQ